MENSETPAATSGDLTIVRIADDHFDGLLAVTVAGGAHGPRTVFAEIEWDGDELAACGVDDTDPDHDELAEMLAERLRADVERNRGSW